MISASDSKRKAESWKRNRRQLAYSTVGTPDYIGNNTRIIYFEEAFDTEWYSVQILKSPFIKNEDKPILP